MTVARIRRSRQRSALGVVTLLCAVSTSCSTSDSQVSFPDGSFTLLDGSAALPDGSSPALPGSVALGQPCRGYNDCASVAGKVVDCYCDTQQVIPICLKQAELGESCAVGGCVKGTTCIGLNNSKSVTCHPLGQLGDPCGPRCTGKSTCFVACDDPYFCDGTGVCAVGHLDLGAACTAPWECRAPYYCEASVCATPRSVGAACPEVSWPEKRSPCVAGAVCSLPNAAGKSVCVAIQPDGAPCSHPNECASEICFSGRCGRGLVPGGVVPSCTSR